MHADSEGQAIVFWEKAVAEAGADGKVNYNGQQLSAEVITGDEEKVSVVEGISHGNLSLLSIGVLGHFRRCQSREDEQDEQGTQEQRPRC